MIYIGDWRLVPNRLGDAAVASGSLPCIRNATIETGMDGSTNAS